MTPERIKKIQASINTYIKTRVQEEVQTQVSHLIETHLKPLAEDFLARNLEKYLHTHLEDALHNTLGSFEEVFENPEDAPESVVQSITGKIYRRTEEDLTEAEADPTQILLGYLEDYQVKTNRSTLPSTRNMSKGTGLGSLDITLGLETLVKSGRIKVTTLQHGNGNRLHIKVPLTKEEKVQASLI